MNEITYSLQQHYQKTFDAYGPTSEGIDWGEHEERVTLRYEKMAQLFETKTNASVLDVGCGFGGFQNYLEANGYVFDYHGIDVVDNMITWARTHQNNACYISGDVLTYEFERQFDYLICNGILTQKLEASILEMDAYAKALIKRMFSLSKNGIAFNIMSTKVNFFSENLYYRSPVEMLAYCMSEFSTKIKIDHSYLYEYTIYIYK